MVIKLFKYSLMVVVLLSLCSCPDDTDCNDLFNGSITRVDNLILLTPLQEVYQRGEIITIEVTIPATNTYFGEQELNLYELTDDQSALLVMSYDFFTDNIITFIKGSQGAHGNWLEVLYNEINQQYELKFTIQLNRLGEYAFYTDDSIEFQGSEYCNRFFIDTNIAGAVDNVINFTVVE